MDGLDDTKSMNSDVDMKIQKGNNELEESGDSQNKEEEMAQDDSTDSEDNIESEEDSESKEEILEG